MSASTRCRRCGHLFTSEEPIACPACHAISAERVRADLLVQFRRMLLRVVVLAGCGTLLALAVERTWETVLTGTSAGAAVGLVLSLGLFASGHR